MLLSFRCVGYLVAGGILLCAGCATTARYVEPSCDKPHAVLVFKVSEKIYGGVGQSNIKPQRLNDLGLPFWKMDMKRFDIDPGRMQVDVVVVGGWTMGGTARLSFDAVAGETYYVASDPDGVKDGCLNVTVTDEQGSCVGAQKVAMVSGPIIDAGAGADLAVKTMRAVKGEDRP